jgi:NOL1/NOP2/fmu family ribosome biogenesis protein/precorrin-6B methylase 2
MAAGVLLDPQPGEWVLDIAAAPGGKATHIAARMQGEGVLVANEVGRRRATVLAMNLERMGVTNAIVTNELPDRLASRWPGLFDAVLVDAPCSGEGTFARDAQSVQAWSVETVQGHARHQITIMDQSAPLVRPGGRLLYGTCTFAPEENEGVVAEFLRQHPDFEVLALPQLPGLSAGRPEWLVTGEEMDPLDADLETALRQTGRFWPHTGPGHGHFYALLRRRGDPPTDLPVQWEETEVPGRVLRLYRQGLRKALKGKDAIPEAGLFLAEDDALYVTPLDPALWQDLRVLRPGWWVATLRHGRVNPDHALAMALRPEHARDALSLAHEDARIDKFLNGGFWPDQAKAKGWVLVTVDGFPLGWGKRGGGRLRSRYPIHLRKA